jgi:hypothetical protein
MVSWQTSNCEAGHSFAATLTATKKQFGRLFLHITVRRANEMRLLEERIETDGRVKAGNILKVTAF